MSARRAVRAAWLGAAVLAALGGARADAPPKVPLAFDLSMSVYNRMLRPAEPAEAVDWEGRVTRLLHEQGEETILTAVGDMIFNQQITGLPEPHHRQLLRVMQEADIAYGNLEFSLNTHPEAQRPFYNFRADPAFAWEVAATGINLVSMANNHALDFGPEGLRESLTALDRAGIEHAGAGTTLAAAREPATKKVQGRKARFAMLSYMRYWTAKYRCADASAPCLATINPATILVARPGGAVEAVEGPLEADIQAMEDDIVLAKRHNDLVIVTIHNHDVSHQRVFGVQDVTPPNDEIMFRRAIDAGADIVLGSGPHVLRGIEVYKGKPILYSLGDFIYQYRTPDKIPIDLPHQRDGEIDRGTNLSVWDRRDLPATFEGLLARFVLHGTQLARIELLPVTIDDEGPLYGVPRLATSARGKAILDRVARLSVPYKTRLAVTEWYATVMP